MRRKRKEKPLLQVLLIAALALNTTVSFVVLAGRDRIVGLSEKTEPLPVAAARTGNGTTAKAEAPAVPKVPSEPDPPAIAKRAEAPKAARRRNPPARVKRPRRERDEIAFLPSPVLYRLSRDTVLVTRRDGARIFLSKGTRVRVAGVTQSNRALVVSRRGNPDGFIPTSSLGNVTGKQVMPDSARFPDGATVNADRTDKIPGSLRLSGGPYEASIGLGAARIVVGRNGQVSGSLSR